MVKQFEIENRYKEKKDLGSENNNDEDIVIEKL